MSPDIFEQEPSRFVESWHPEVGQRVRVRLSGECNLPARKGSLADRRHGGAPHAPCDSMLGYVTEHNAPRDTIEFYSSRGHRYRVEFDEPVEVLDGTLVGADIFAAIELEPIDD